MDEIIEQVESLIARANIGVIVTMNGTDHHLINQLNRIKEALTKQKWQQHGVMQAGSEKQPYFKLSTNEFGKHWLFYKPLKSEPGKYGCWTPIDDEFYSEFNKLQKAALGSEAAVGKAGEDASVSDGK